jgi:hypothetical protein
MGKGKALLRKRGGQRKFLLGKRGERGRSTEVKADWDCPPVL